VLKIITAGDEGVGKTTLLNRYVKGIFLSHTQTTLGVEFIIKELDINELHIMLQLWDFGGQEHFRHLLKRYALGAKGALIVFDLTRRDTLENIGEWVEICRMYDKKLPIIFIGSKLDLQEKISVEDQVPNSLMEKHNLFEYKKVSSKNGINVSEAFESLTKKILNREKEIYQ